MLRAEVSLQISHVQELVITQLTPDHSDAVLLTQVDVEVSLPEELLTAHLALEHGVLGLLVKVVLRLAQSSLALEDVGAGDDGVAGDHGGALLRPQLLLLVVGGGELWSEGRRDGEDTSGSAGDHNLLVTSLPGCWRWFAGVATWRWSHDRVQLLLGEVVLQVLLAVRLVHVDLEVVVTSETLITNWAPDT